MTLLSFAAFILLPRQFHVAVVENNSESEIKRAVWLYPVYLVLINLFVVPIALAGLLTFPTGNVDSDMFVLALPLESGSSVFTIIAFVGGLSAATAMVIVESFCLLTSTTARPARHNSPRSVSSPSPLSRSWRRHSLAD
jgi:Na+/proline symporter